MRFNYLIVSSLASASALRDLSRFTWFSKTLMYRAVEVLLPGRDDERELRLEMDFVGGEEGDVKVRSFWLT